MKPKLTTKMREQIKVFNIDLQVVASNAVYIQDDERVEDKEDIFQNESIENFI